MDLDEEDEDEVAINNHNRHQLIDGTNGIVDNNQDNHAVIYKNQPYSTTANNKTKHPTKLPVQDNNINSNEQQTGGGGQQDEWEEFEDPNSKYDQLRLKFSRGGTDQNNFDEDEDNDDYYDDGQNHEGNIDENTNNIGGDDDQASRNNRRREQQKDKPAWKLDQVKPTEPNDVTDSPVEKVEEPITQAKPAPAATSSVYRPPQLRGNSSVTVVSGINQRPSKKEKPNLASTEDFPTLGAAVNKK